MLQQDKKTIAEVAARIASGIIASGKEADLVQVVAHALALVVEVDRVVDEKKAPFADDAQAILTLRNAGYEVERREKFEEKAKLFLEKRGFDVRQKQEEKKDDTRDGQEESGGVSDRERSEGDKRGQEKAKG